MKSVYSGCSAHVADLSVAVHWQKNAWVTRNVQYSVELVLAERRRWVSALSGQFCTIQVLAGMEKLTTWNCWGDNTFIQTGVWAMHICPDHRKIHIHKASTVECYILACRLHCSLSIIDPCTFHTHIFLVFLLTAIMYLSTTESWEWEYTHSHYRVPVFTLTVLHLTSVWSWQSTWSWQRDWGWQSTWSLLRWQHCSIYCNNWKQQNQC